MARSTERGRGNIPADEEFIEWMQERGRLSIISEEEDPTAIPFAAKVRFKGKRDEEGSPWLIPPEGKSRCNARAYVRDFDGDYILDEDDNRVMRPCYNWAMKGLAVCLFHGGGTKVVRQAAQDRMASALDAVTGALIKIALNPNALDKDRLVAIEKIMSKSGLRDGIDIEIKDPAYVGALRKLFTEAGIDAEEGEEGEGD